MRGLKLGKTVFQIDQDGVRFAYGKTEKFGTFDDAIEDVIGYDINITSSNGDTFINGAVNTILSIVVMKGQEDITETLNENNFTWKKILANGQEDKSWIPNYVAGTKHRQVQVLATDIDQKATFYCEVEIDKN